MTEETSTSSEEIGLIEAYSPEPKQVQASFRIPWALFSKRRPITVTGSVDFASHGALSQWAFEILNAFSETIRYKGADSMNIKGRDSSRKPSLVKELFSNERDEVLYIGGTDVAGDKIALHIRSEFLDFPDNSSIRFSLERSNQGISRETAVEESVYGLDFQAEEFRFGLELFASSFAGRGYTPGLVAYVLFEANAQGITFEIFDERFTKQEPKLPFERQLRELSYRTESLVTEPLWSKISQVL